MSGKDLVFDSHIAYGVRLRLDGIAQDKTAYPDLGHGLEQVQKMQVLGSLPEYHGAEVVNNLQRHFGGYE